MFGALYGKMFGSEIQTPGNHPKEGIQHSGHGESLKSRRFCNLCCEAVCNGTVDPLPTMLQMKFLK